VSFQDDPAAAPAPGSGNKVNKASTEDATAGHTPMVRVKALEKGPAKVAVPETPFFSAQNCSSCTLHPLESADYWLAHIRLAESVGKHGVSAAFFRLAFECQAQVRLQTTVLPNILSDSRAKHFNSDVQF
jgi:hypothetical protein